MPRSFGTLAELRTHVGEELGVSEWFPIAQQRINTFADATDDWQWIHTDPERARREGAGATMAHGFMTLALLAPLFATALTIGETRTSINYGLNRVRFISPVLSGERIRARFRLQEFQPLESGVQLLWAVTMEREGHEKPAMVAEWLMRRIP
jgi:acyl dehydratase